MWVTFVSYDLVLWTRIGDNKQMKEKVLSHTLVNQNT